jgi:hypothetical protein
VSTRDGALPRGQRPLVSPPGSPATDEVWPGANEAKVEKLLLRKLQRRAQAGGLELRHSEYGYALIDSQRKRVDDRNDLTLREVESCLGRR